MIIYKQYLLASSLMIPEIFTDILVTLPSIPNLLRILCVTCTHSPFLNIVEEDDGWMCYLCSDSLSYLLISLMDKLIYPSFRCICNYLRYIFCSYFSFSLPWFLGRQSTPNLNTIRVLNQILTTAIIINIKYFQYQYYWVFYLILWISTTVLKINVRSK